MAEGPKSLLDEQKLVYQRRLAHFLRDYRKKNNIKASEMAETLSYSYVRYLELEKADKPQDRYIRSVDFLFRLASLKDLSLTEFVTYLEEGDSKPRLQKSNWEEILLGKFDKLDLSVKNDFISVLKKSDKKHSEVLLGIANLLGRLDGEVSTVLQKLLESIIKSGIRGTGIREP